MHISNHNNCVVKCSVNIGNTRFDILFSRRLRVGLVRFLPPYFILFFLPAIATALPLRVRALF